MCIGTSAYWHVAEAILDQADKIAEEIRNLPRGCCLVVTVDCCNGNLDKTPVDVGSSGYYALLARYPNAQVFYASPYASSLDVEEIVLDWLEYRMRQPSER